MTLLSLTDCCRLLAIDPKTLRRWLRLARLPLQPHPLDARLKCLTREQVQQVAATHHRALPASLELQGQSEPSALAIPERNVSGGSAVGPEGSAHLAALTKQLADLQVHVATLQHQLTRLADPWPKEQHRQTSKASRTKDKSLKSSLQNQKKQASDRAAAQEVSMDRRKHPHVLPLVEYGAQGKYVVISPELGILVCEPDSPEWFAWLSTLASFRFVGQQGRFTAHRGAQGLPSRSWRASRQIRNRSYNQHLGKTQSLTIAALEHVAAVLQSHLN